MITGLNPARIVGVVLLVSLPLLNRALAGQAPSALRATVPSVTQSNALLRATFYPKSAGTIRAWFRWGKTTDTPNQTRIQVLSGGTSLIAVSNLLGRLAPNQTYYFRCFASNRFGVSRSALVSFKTKHDIQFQPFEPVATGTDRALLTGSFTARFGGKTWFIWGGSSNLLTFKTRAANYPATTSGFIVTNLLTGLASNSTYYYRLVASNRFGLTRSPIYTFETKHDVQFQGLNAVDIGSDRALLSGTFTGQHNGQAWFAWGNSPDLLLDTPAHDYSAGNGAILVTNLLTGLTPNRTYHYRVIASNEFGVSGSSVGTFTTLLNFAIGVVDVHVNYAHDPTQAALTGTMIRPWDAIAWFEWGRDTNAPTLTNPWQADYNQYRLLWGLEPNTLYHCRFVATNVYGRQSTPWKPFRTGTGLTVTTYPAASANTYPAGPGYPRGIGAISSTTAQFGALISNVLPPITDAWFEWGKTTNYEHRTAIIASAVGGFQILAEVSGLEEAGVVYHFRAVASNSIGMAFGTNVSFTIPFPPFYGPT